MTSIKTYTPKSNSWLRPWLWVASVETRGFAAAGDVDGKLKINILLTHDDFDRFSLLTHARGVN